jgi:hypothetical protein
MRTRALALVVAFALTVVVIGAASAQIPFIAVYFDQYYSVEALPPPPCADPCPGIGVIDYAWIALVNANRFVTGVDFAVNYPPEMIWLADLDTQPVLIGSTPTGFSMGWGLPQNGFAPVPICKVKFMWNCAGCPAPNIPVKVVANPNTGDLAFTDFPSFAIYPAVGLTALICACVPAEETTWGQVKALFE